MHQHTHTHKHKPNTTSAAKCQLPVCTVEIASQPASRVCCFHAIGNGNQIMTSMLRMLTYLLSGKEEGKAHRQANSHFNLKKALVISYAVVCPGVPGLEYTCMISI